MSITQPFRFKLPAWADWFALGLMAIAAPLIAALVHSTCVFQSGIRFYNAQIWGLDGFRSILAFIGGCGIPAIPTFLVLLRFRHQALARWLVWMAFIILWTWLLFKMEYAIQ
jgi:hypothetical protein